MSLVVARCRLPLKLKPFPNRDSTWAAVKGLAWILDDSSSVAPNLMQRSDESTGQDFLRF